MVDNFDTDISSPNGKLSTHSLAKIMTHQDQPNAKETANKIARLTHTEAKLPIEDGIERISYNGSKKPPMPAMQTQNNIAKANNSESEKTADEKDYTFLRNILTQPHCPEFGGFNTKLMRQEDREPHP